MKLTKLFLLYLLFSVLTPALANSLVNHPSPYLRMHQTDPVAWQTWGPDVLAQAKKENKLIYMSIGYFSCHWCHVMQKESYANQEIGDILNKHYIPVKVDRELRPELDRRMIGFVEKVRGQAGWPLNVFISPEGYPITGFTYIPKNDFQKILLSLQTEWINNHKKLAAASKQFFQESETDEKKTQLFNLPDQHFDKVVDAFISQAMLIGDDLQGGFGQTNKFPSYPQINALMQVVIHGKEVDDDVINFVELTLDAMATKNLMDHVNYGFYRYVTDPDWQTPHFEKMLYDNAQLASLYFDAHQYWPQKGYDQIALNTLKFMNQFLANGEGGFYASLSAVDTDNNEGGAYYWEASELKQALQEDYDDVKKAWGFSDDESLIQTQPLSGLGMSLNDKAQAQRVLNKLRATKKLDMPVDTKSLASWNALALKAWVKAAQHSNDKAMLDQSKEIYIYIVKNFIKNGEVITFANHGDASETTLEDYVQLAHAIQLYANLSKDQQAQDIAKVLVGISYKKYFKNGRWFRNTESLIPGENGELIIQDAVLQSPFALILKTVLLMEKPDEDIKKRTLELLKWITKDVLDIPYYYGSVIMLRQLEQNK